MSTVHKMIKSKSFGECSATPVLGGGTSSDPPEEVPRGVVVIGTYGFAGQAWSEGNPLAMLDQGWHPPEGRF